jgi:glycosyltransferase involved in cell wall biosynthesis
LFFSIITPTFNSEKFIKRHIDSLNLQKNIFEQIVIDNYSSDQTLKIIKSRAKYPIRIVKEKDDGIYDAMNKGAKYANGDFYLFLNSDDWIDPETFILVEKKIRDNPNFDIYYGNTRYFKQEELYFEQKSKIKFLQFTNSISHQAIYYKNSIFLKNTYNKNYKIAADYDFNLNLLNKDYKFFYINEFLSNNSMGGASSRLLPSFKEFYSIQIKNNGVIKGILFTFYEYKFKILKLFILLFNDKKN